MKFVFLTLICLHLFAGLSHSQNIQYRDSINKILKQQAKGTKSKRERIDSSKIVYQYTKNTNELVAIFKFNNKSHRGASYEYINRDLVRVIVYIPYSDVPSSIGKRKYGFYYFQNRVLMHKEELNFPAIDINYYKEEGLKLIDRAKMYFNP